MNYQKYLALLLIGLAWACSSEPAAEEAKWPQSEVVESDLGFGPVYGVKVMDYSPKATARSYALQLSLGDKVWLDTLYLDLGAQDTVSSEVFFGDAAASAEAQPTHRLELLNAE